ncbi:hypothetical protein GF389_01485 [Candidatus Dojkabacteria bacterium]|nr:hypothetical protein [Candidatus Dojkabacteria bacterium]
MNYYIDKIKESVRFAWKYKFLWVFGFLIAAFGGNGYSGNTNFGSPGDLESTNGSGDDFANDVDELFSNPTFWIVMAVLLCLVFVISFIGWYLLSLSKGALTEAVRKDKASQDMSFKSSWRDGRKHALDIMILDLVGLFINITVLVPLIAVVILAAMIPPVFILFCCLVPFYILYFIGWMIVYTVAHRYLVLNNAGAWESIKVGFKVLKERVLNFVLAGLVSLIPGCLWAILAMVIVIVPTLLLMLVGLGILFVNPIAGIIALAFAILVAIVLGALVNSPYQVFSYAYWTKIVMDLLDDKAPR